jgi:Fe-S-cluster containining protein
MLRVVKGWCVFFNKGCVLHRVGAAEGDSYRYKPAMCALFPLAKDGKDRWYVRQWGYKGETWDLFCLNPKQSRRRAATSLRAEVALASRFEAEAAEAEKQKAAESNSDK